MKNEIILTNEVLEVTVDSNEVVEVVETSNKINVQIGEVLTYEGGSGVSGDVTHSLSSFASLQDAINTISSSPAKLLIDRNETINSNITIPSNIDIKGKKGYKLTVLDTFTLTINSYIDCDTFQIFDLQGTAKLTGKPKNQYLWAEWFGVSTDSADNSTAFTKTWESGVSTKTYIRIGNGKFLFTNPVTLITSGVGSGFEGAGTIPKNVLKVNYPDESGWKGTILDFRPVGTAYAGTLLTIGDNTSQVTHLKFNGINVIGDTAVGNPVMWIKYAPQKGHIDDVTVVQVGDGDGLKITDIWTGFHISDIWCWNTNGARDTVENYGFILRGERNSGGNIFIYNLNVGGFKYGRMFGFKPQEKDANSKSERTIFMQGSQTNDAIYGTYIGFGITHMSIFNDWTEGVTQKGYIINGNAREIVFNECRMGGYQLTAGGCVLQLGSPDSAGVTTSIDKRARVVLNNCFIHGLQPDTTGIKRYKSGQDSTLYINNCDISLDGTLTATDKAAIYGIKLLGDTGNSRSIVLNQVEFGQSTNSEINSANRIVYSDETETSFVDATDKLRFYLPAKWSDRGLLQKTDLNDTKIDNVTLKNMSVLDLNLTGAGWLSSSSPNFVKITNLNGAHKAVYLPDKATSEGKYYIIHRVDTDSTHYINIRESTADGSATLFRMWPNSKILIYNFNGTWNWKSLTDKEIGNADYRVSMYNGLADAINKIGTENAILLIDKNETLSANLTIPENIDLKFKKGNVIDGAHTLTINGGIIAGLWQIFGSSVTVNRNPKITEVYPEWFGAVGDGVTDDTQAIQKTIDTGISRVIIPANTYKVTTTLFLSYNQSLIGVSAEKSVFLIEDDFVSDTTISGNQAGGQYVIAQNTTDGATWVQQFPNMRLGEIRDFTIDGSNRTNRDDIRALLIFGGARVFNVIGKKLSQMVNVDGNFADQIWIKRVKTQDSSKLIDSNGNDIYNIDTCSLGDFGVIEQCHFPENWDGIRPNGIRGRNNKALTVIGIGNGNHYFAKTILTMLDCYMEHCYLKIENSIAKIINLTIKPKWDDTTTKWIDIYSESNVSFDNLNVYTIYKGSHTNFDTYGWRENFICISSDCEVSFKDCKNLNIQYGALGDYRRSGILVSDRNGNYIKDWKRFAGYLSANGRISPAYKIDYNFNLDVNKDKTLYLGTSNTTTEVDTWRISSGTYYYRFQVLYDPERNIGKQNTNEFSFTITNGDAAIPVMRVEKGGLDNANIIRILRGTQSGVYDKYVEIPFGNSIRFIDNGEVINGFYWQDIGQSDFTYLRSIKGKIFGNDMFIGQFHIQIDKGIWKEGDVVYDEVQTDMGDGRIREGWKIIQGGWFPTLNWAASTSYAVGNKIQPTTPNGYYYECIQAGTSGTTEPTWTTTVGSTFTDGTVVWECKGTVAQVRKLYSIKDGNSDLKFTNNAVGVILKSPNGTFYRIKVDDTGTLITEVV